MAKEEVRKGPWTEQEDVQLVFYVNLFGDRRWDFIAKVSGLKRTGKSCRLRWVNYLHPDLKRGKMTPHEERLILELQSKWGNRWSKIARKVPGRTDNEIKNYWRTYMRKKAQERKKGVSSSSSSSLSSSNSSSSSVLNSHKVESTPVVETKEHSFNDTGAVDNMVAGPGEQKTGSEVEDSDKVYHLDDLWEELEFSEEISNPTIDQTMASPIWDYCPSDLPWSMGGEESKMLMQPVNSDHFYSFSFYNQYCITG